MAKGDRQARELRIEALEAQVQQLLDANEIREVLSRYGYHADVGRDEEYLDLYIDDCAHDVGWPEEFDIPAYRGEHRWEGKAGLRELIEDPRGHANEFYGRRMHIQGLNPVVHIDGDRAIVNDYWLALRWHEGQIVVGSGGNDQWRLRKVDGEWRLEERRLRHIGHPGYRTNLEATPR